MTRIKTQRALTTLAPDELSVPPVDHGVCRKQKTADHTRRSLELMLMFMELSTDLSPLERTHEITEPVCRRVLILEDEPALRRILRITFTSWGWLAAAAASLTEAQLLTLEHSPFELIVTDYHLPDGTGQELMSWIVSTQGSLPPCILMSADARMLVASNARRLQKPFSIHELKQAVDAVLTRKATNTRHP